MSSAFHCSSLRSTSSAWSEGSKCIKLKKCIFLPCRFCKAWHCACTPCGHHKRAKVQRRRLEDEKGTVTCKRDSMSGSKCHVLERKHRPLLNYISYYDVRYHVQEEDIRIDREDISKWSCHKGRVFNVCRAYVGEDDERVAVKWVRASHDCDRNHYMEAIEQAKESAKIVRAFMGDTDTHGWKVKVLIPKKAKGWHIHEGHHHTSIIVEPYLNHFEIFYKKSEDIHCWRGHVCFKVLEALIHYSIRQSKRKKMISNLKGFVDTYKKIIYVSGPRVQDHKVFEGGRGCISAFLREHHCSDMCRKCYQVFPMDGFYS
eukprot:gb/GEZJ01000112.1/.p1 GENE.gb/GEZJ01000112.1/~~gb/GEZJ01000112.1/.p1  ORF type:complete len:315 (+),score=22.90 gb/GEZJ01000112.1/:288-1232(+)